MTIYDDVIDLRPYVLALLHRWWVVVLLGVIAAAVSMGISQVPKKTYSSTATILVTRTSATLSLAEQFPTVKEPVDTGSRMSAFLSIARNDSIAIKVYDQVKNLGFPQEQNWALLKNMVSVSNQGDAILITATDHSPQLAADIATSWAKETVASINSAYISNEPLAVIQTEKDAAEQEYLTAQTNLEAFIKENQIDLLNAQINETKTLFNSYAYDRDWQITYWNQRRLDMETLITEIEALQKQLQSGVSSTAGSLGDALAVLMTRFRSLNIPQNQTGNTGQASNTGQMGIELNLQISDTKTINDNLGNTQADIEALLKLAVNEKAAAEAKLESFRSEGSNQLLIEEIATKTRALETELESQKARSNEFTDKRDLALKAYQTLSEKVIEIETAPQNSYEVILAEPGVQPLVANPRNTIRNILMGGVLGLVVGFIAVITMEWWRTSGIKQTKVVST
jgi:capsular polysaccharide biosynthesis protein